MGVKNFKIMVYCVIIYLHLVIFNKSVMNVSMKLKQIYKKNKNKTKKTPKIYILKKSLPTYPILVQFVTPIQQLCLA